MCDAREILVIEQQIRHPNSRRMGRIVESTLVGNPEPWPSRSSLACRRRGLKRTPPGGVPRLLHEQHCDTCHRVRLTPTCNLQVPEKPAETPSKARAICGVARCSRTLNDAVLSFDETRGTGSKLPLRRHVTRFSWKGRTGRHWVRPCSTECEYCTVRMYCMWLISLRGEVKAKKYPVVLTGQPAS